MVSVNSDMTEIHMTQFAHCV